MKIIKQWLKITFVLAPLTSWACPHDHYEQCLDIGGWGIVRQCVCLPRAGGVVADFAEGFKKLGSDLTETGKQNLANAPDALSRIIETPRELVQGFGCTLTNDHGSKIGGGHCPQTEKVLVGAEAARERQALQRTMACQELRHSLDSQTGTLSRAEWQKSRLQGVLNEVANYAHNFMQKQELEELRQTTLRLGTVAGRVHAQTSRDTLLAKVGEINCSDIDLPTSIHQKLYCMGNSLAAINPNVETQSENIELTLALLPFLINSLAEEAQDYSEAVALVGPENVLKFLDLVAAAGGGQMLYHQQIQYFNQEIAVTDAHIENARIEIQEINVSLQQNCQGV